MRETMFETKTQTGRMMMDGPEEAATGAASMAQTSTSTCEAGDAWKEDGRRHTGAA